MAVLQPTVVKYHMGSDVNAVYFPQLGHLAVLTNRNMSIEFPAHLEWELRVSPGLTKMEKVLMVVHNW
jgi:hypothetical protein